MAWAATTTVYNPFTGRLDFILNSNNLGDATGTTLASTGLVCNGFASGGKLTTDANGNFICQNDVSAGGTAHNLLSATHSDSVAASATRGDLIAANASASWARLAVGASPSVLTANGTDPSWSVTPTVTSLTANNTVTGTTLDVTGRQTKLNGAVYNWPSADGSSAQVLTTNGSGGLSWATVATAANNLSFFASTTSAQLAGVISDETGSGLLVYGTSATMDSLTTTTFVKIPTGAAPTVDAAGKIAIDTTDDQLVYYGGSARILPYTQFASMTVEYLKDTDDNIPIFTAPYALTITGVACTYVGTGTTVATFTLEDGSANAMTITGTNPTCVAHGTNQTFAAVTAGNGLVAGEVVRFDTTNTPAPTTDTYTITLKYTVDAQ